ncbi:hypothetical protein AC249_AIPGENE5089, partial [Exaiptasia diaphana]
MLIAAIVDPDTQAIICATKVKVSIKAQLSYKTASLTNAHIKGCTRTPISRSAKANEPIKMFDGRISEGVLQRTNKKSPLPRNDKGAVTTFNAMTVV